MGVHLMVSAFPGAQIHGDKLDYANEKRSTLSICLRCRDGKEGERDDERGGTRLAQKVLSAGIDHLEMDVRGIHYMSQCKRPYTIALTGPDKFTYIFGDLEPTLHASHIIELAKLYLKSDDGFMARNDRPEVMRNGVLGRVPPLGWSGHAVETIPLNFSNSKERKE